MKNQVWLRVILIFLMAWLPVSAIAAPALSVCQTRVQAAESSVLSMGAVTAMECDGCAMPCSENESMACQLGSGCGTCILPLLDTFTALSADQLGAYAVHTWPYPISHIAELLERPPAIG